MGDRQCAGATLVEDHSGEPNDESKTNKPELFAIKFAMGANSINLQWQQMVIH